MRIPSLIKKYLMALTGLALVLFVVGHMLGNLQVYLEPYYINAYALKLKELGPGLWLIRLALLAIVAVHVWTAISLTRENRAARPETYKAEATVQATYASRTMPMSGLIILAFIIFHIAHYTTRSVPGHDYDESIVMSDGTVYEAYIPLLHKGEEAKATTEIVHDVHTMMVAGFSYGWISIFYIIAMALLCLHLTHGISSMFQSLGLRNKTWRKRLDPLAKLIGILLFVGFSSIPVAIMAGIVSPQGILVTG